MDELSNTDFNYESLDPESRLQLRVKESEIEVLLGQTELYARQTILAAIELGKKLIEVQELFRHNKNGGFEGWWKGKSKRSKQTAYNCINLAKKINSQTVGRLHNIGLSALQLLAAPSVPDSTIEEAIQRAEAGETITKSVARDIISSQKSIETLTSEAKERVKRIAEGFIEICKIAYEFDTQLGHEEYIKRITLDSNISIDMAERILKVYECFGNNPQLVEISASKIIEEHFDLILILSGLGEALQNVA